MKSRPNPINIVRLTATLCVFMTHTMIFEKESFLEADGWTFLFRPSAWGGVWMFFVLSGYLAGKTYAHRRYELTVYGALRYYRRRISKVLVPVLCFILLCAVLTFPSFFPNNPDALIKILTLRYNGNPGVNGIGACWYIFTLFWLWTLTPFAAFIFQKGLQQRERVLLFALIVVLGYLFRFVGLMLEWNWYVKLYTPPYANFDLYFGGMLAAFLIHDVSVVERSSFPRGDVEHLYPPPDGFWKKSFRAFAGGAFAMVILTNCWIYNRSVFPSDFIVAGRPLHEFCNTLHVRLYPTLYLLSLSLYFAAFDAEKESAVTMPPLRLIRRNPLLLIDAFASISFEFYLFHSLILNQISPFFNGRGPLTNHLLLLLCAGALTLLFSIGFHRVFLSRRQSGASQN